MLRANLHISSAASLNNGAAAGYARPSACINIIIIFSSKTTGNLRLDLALNDAIVGVHGRRRTRDLSTSRGPPFTDRVCAAANLVLPRAGRRPIGF